ncbi:MAG: hypothetical protein GDA51_12020 [Ekhidna sp.]|nr:hypothetical protein [Ekhidna sp.]
MIRQSEEGFYALLSWSFKPPRFLSMCYPTKKPEASTFPIFHFQPLLLSSYFGSI